LRLLLTALLLGVAFAGTAAYAQTPAATESRQKEATPPPPADPPPQNLPLVTEPPAAPPEVDETPRALRSVWEGVTLDRLLHDVNITDLAMALFALVVALFTWRLSVSNARLREVAEGKTEESRKIIEASESAAEAARRSAETAEQTLGILRDTAERQLRAYVTIKQFLPTPNGQGWQLQVVWQNSGATPTKGFRYWAMLREFDDAIPDDFEFTPAGLKDYAGGELGSNGNVSSPPLFMAPQTLAGMRDGSRKVLLLGQAGYADFGGHHARRETRFCVEVVLTGDPNGASGPPFSFTYYPRHNYIT
jgi:hypothetical protein